VRGKIGRIATDHGVFITPDTAAHGLGEHPQHVYSVSFTALELWGAAPGQRLHRSVGRLSGGSMSTATLHDYAAVGLPATRKGQCSISPGKRKPSP
jgi:hypothetical protein